MLAVNVLAGSWTVRILRWATFLALIVFRRWRHLFVFARRGHRAGGPGLSDRPGHRTAAAARRDDPGAVERLLDALAAGRGTRGDADRDGRTRSSSPGGTATRRSGRSGSSSAWSGSPGCTWASTSRPSAGFGAILGVAIRVDRVPMVHAERRLPRHVPAREGRAPRRRRAARRGDRPGRARTSSAST